VFAYDIPEGPLLLTPNPGLVLSPNPILVLTTAVGLVGYRGTSLIRIRAPPGLYSRTMPRVALAGVLVFMSEVPLYPSNDISRGVARQR